MCVYEKEADLGEQLVTYSAILDGLDTTMAQIMKADNLHGLTDVQAQSLIQLQQMYDIMIGDTLDLEKA